ncbi:solute carrier organic anion transporter family member 74D-like [Artemia franciscana]|uniref:solute carrier organic anion transporter family member 74D-like n=1 Tax=Artemia franciscana TaxID=6661 RepID=UPI0032DB91F1
MDNKGYSGSCDGLSATQKKDCVKEVQVEKKYESEPYNRYLCGIGGFYPNCLQRYATRKVYVLIYSLLGLVQAMYFAYFVAVSTTIERQFKLRSQITGFILTGNEISEIILSLILSYFGNKGNRPKLVAAGTLCTSFSCFLAILPHFAMGGEGSNRHIGNASLGEVSGVCISSPLRAESGCTEPQQSSIFPVVVLFMSKFISGITTTIFYSLGFAYMDDNSKETQTPILIGKFIYSCFFHISTYLQLGIF